MTTERQELTVRGVRFWVGKEIAEPSRRLRRVGSDSGPADVVLSFGRIGRDGKPSESEVGHVRYDSVRRLAVANFERRTETVEAGSALEALERFLRNHLLPGRIILLS
jgi:hypothetical protein